MNRLELTDDELESLKDLIAYSGGKIDEEHYSQKQNFNVVIDALDMGHLNELDVPEEWGVETDGGLDLPVQFDRAGSDAETPDDALDDLQAGDRVLWGERSQPLTVARVVDPDDPEGQSLTASVLKHSPEEFRGSRYSYEVGRDLKKGDVFLDPTAWGSPTGRRFALVQGPRGGFYLLTKDQQNPRSGRLALFRCVRASHSTKMGRRGEGAWNYEEKIDTLELVERGDQPDELDPEGDLPTLDEIADRPLVVFDRENDEIGHVEVGTVSEAFEGGLQNSIESAKARARNELDDEEEESVEDALPTAEEVETNPDGTPVGYCEVTGVFMSDYGPKAVLDTPAPWEVADYETPANEVLKSTPWEENHRTFDGDRKAWTVDLDELRTTALVLSDAGYSVQVAEDALELPA